MSRAKQPKPELTGLALLLDHCDAVMTAAAAYCPEDLAITLRNRARQCRHESKDAKNDFLRGFVCAVAAHWNQHTDWVSARDLLGCAGSVDSILENADPVDIDTLRQIELLPPLEES